MYEIFAKLLEQKGITPYRVYKETGVAQSSLSDWKNGKGTPSAAKLKLVADFLGVTVDYLMTGEESEQKEKPVATERDGLGELYFTIMKDAQDSEIDPEDIRAAVNFLKEVKKKRHNK